MFPLPAFTIHDVIQPSFSIRVDCTRGGSIKFSTSRIPKNRGIMRGGREGKFIRKVDTQREREREGETWRWKWLFNILTRPFLRFETVHSSAILRSRVGIAEIVTDPRPSFGAARRCCSFVGSSMFRRLRWMAMRPSFLAFSSCWEICERAVVFEF